MENSLFVATLVFFIVGLLLTTAATQRDLVAIKRIQGKMRWRQWALVCSDFAQIGFFSFGIASIIQNHTGRIELGITWTLQCMACTNVRSQSFPLNRSNVLVHTVSASYLLRFLVAACSVRSTGAIHCAQWHSLSYPVRTPLTMATLINNRRQGNAPAIYDLVLLVAIYAGSTLMARVGYSRLREHETSGGNNRSIRILFWSIVITNEIAIPTVCISIGTLIALRARREATFRIRMMVMLVNESLHLI